MISKKIFKQHSLLEHPLLWRTNIDIDWSLECRTLHNICCPIPCHFARIALFAICFVDSAVDLLQSSRYIYKQAHIDPFFMAHCRPQFGISHLRESFWPALVRRTPFEFNFAN